MEFNGFTSTLATPFYVDRTMEKFDKDIATELLDHNSSAELSRSISTFATPAVNMILEEFDKEIAAENPGLLLTTYVYKILTMLSTRRLARQYEDAGSKAFEE